MFIRVIVKDTYVEGVSVNMPVHVQTWETPEEMEDICARLNENSGAAGGGVFGYEVTEVPCV